MPSFRTFISSSRVIRFPLIAWIRTKSANCFFSRCDPDIREFFSPWSSTDIMMDSASKFAQNRSKALTGGEQEVKRKPTPLASCGHPPVQSRF
jgi:hypothetical protein